MSSCDFQPIRPPRARKLIAIPALALLLFPAVGGCRQAGKNVLLGSWKYSSATGSMSAKVCEVTQEFTENAWKYTMPGDLGPTTVRVTYNITPQQIFVINPNTEGSQSYVSMDKDHIYTESAWGRCIYERVK